MTEIIPIAVLVTVLLVLAETSYLTYRATRTNKIKHDSILLDTSVLIDGRIVDIARSGLLTAPLIIPKSVMHELQFMADKADHNKRERARFGLDVIEQLQQIEQTDLTIIDDGEIDVHGVDEQLIVLAKRYGARLCTIDFNLNKVARVQEVIVVNINELAHALRIVHLPGETVEVKLVQAGQEKKQAVGYLEDGTMVVVDEARDLVGQSVEVSITRALQTAAGSMMFARLVSKKKPAQNSSDRNSSGKTSKKFPARTRSEATMLANDDVSSQTTPEAPTDASASIEKSNETSTPMNDSAPAKRPNRGRRNSPRTSSAPEALSSASAASEPTVAPLQAPEATAHPQTQQNSSRPPRQRQPRQPRTAKSQQSLTPAQQKVAPRRRQDIEDSLIKLANQ